jgi:hypothetical protein
MTSFVRFVLKFKKDDSAIGDLARDMDMDKNLTRTWGYKTVLRYLECHGASSNVFTTLEEAHEIYKRSIL